MAYFYSTHPIINNPPLAFDQDINLLTFTNSIPKVLENGINLIGRKDYPVLNPGKIETHLLGAGFTNMVLQPVFVSKRSKNRGTYYLSIIRTGVGTEDIIEVTPQGEYTTISLFTDFNIDQIKVGNKTEDGVSCTLLYGQGSLIVPPPISVSAVVVIPNPLPVDIVAQTFQPLIVSGSMVIPVATWELMIRTINESYARSNAPGSLHPERKVGDSIQRFVGEAPPPSP